MAGEGGVRTCRRDIGNIQSSLYVLLCQDFKIEFYSQVCSCLGTWKLKIKQTCKLLFENHWVAFYILLLISFFVNHLKSYKQILENIFLHISLGPIVMLLLCKESYP